MKKTETRCWCSHSGHVLNAKHIISCCMNVTGQINARHDTVVNILLNNILVQRGLVSREQKWEERKKRMHMDNLYILMCDRDGITEDDMRKLEQVDCKNKVVLTAKPHPDIDFAFQLPEYAGEDYVGYYLGKNAITDKTVVEKHFDFVKWLNGASPKDCHL